MPRDPTPTSRRSSSKRPAPVDPAKRRWPWGRFAIAGALLVAVAFVLAGKSAPHVDTPATPPLAVSHQPAAASGPEGVEIRVPTLVDLGADQCIPCKAMAPILVSLREEYAGRMRVEFIDVWKNPRAADPYHIYAIPTQIFFDPSGRELHRHEGFISRQDILSTWERLGYEFSAAPGPK